MKALLLSLFAISVLSATAEPARVEHAEAEKLRISWKRARQKAVEPIDAKYKEALKALQVKLEKENRTAEAELVKRRILAIRGPKITVSPSDLVSVKWLYNTRNQSRPMTFMPNGEVHEEAKGSIGKWTAVDDILRIDIGEGLSEFEMEYSDPEPCLYEIRHNGKKRDSVRLTHAPK